MIQLPGSGEPSNGSSSEGGLHDTIRQQEFLRLLETAMPSLTRFCRAMCREHTRRASTIGDGARQNATYGCDEERAKDLISETVLRAYESFERVRDTQAFLSYLFTIAVRLNRREQRQRWRWLPFLKEEIAELPHLVTGNVAAQETAVDLEHLYAAMEKLPEKQREAIVLSEIVGLKLEEVATVQAASLSAVKSRVSRGKQKLAELLGVEHEPDETTRKAPSPGVTQFDRNTPTDASTNLNRLTTRFAFTKEQL